MWGEALRRDPIIVGPPGGVLLWALACEIDDRGATFTGDRVCRACSGRGWTFSHGSTSKIIGSVDPWVTSAVPNIRIDVSRSSDLTGLHPDVHQPRSPWHHASRRDPCPCTGPTRPDTVSLSWLVAHLASQRTPFVNDWPDQWRVDREWERARADDSWQAQWWLAFEIWVTAGIEPDADLLAGLLRALTPDAPVVTEAELHAPRPWFDIDVGTGRIYVDQITVERLPLDSHQSAGGYTFITPQAIPRETTTDITMSSVDVLPVGRAVHEGQIRAFDACRESQTMMTMWVGGEVGSTEIANVWVDDVTTEREHQYGRMSSTFRCRTMEQLRVIV